MAGEKHFYVDPSREFVAAVRKSGGTYQWHVYRDGAPKQWYGSGETRSLPEARREAVEAVRYTLMRSGGVERDRASRAKRGPVDRGMKLAKMIAKFQPAGRRMKSEEKLEWRIARLKWALERDGLSWRPQFREVLVDAAIKEEQRSDSARFRRAYGWS